MYRKLLTATALTGALALPAAAQAHVTLQPDAAPAGRFTRLDVRVPTERDQATRRVVLELPSGFAFASYQPTPGWTVRLTTRKLPHLVKTDDGTVDQEVRRISWTATSAKDAIPPGGFQDFGLSVGMPEGKPGTKLTFKALQTYAGGDVVRWTGSADSESPAPQVTLTDAPDPAEQATRQAGRGTVAPPTAAAGDDLPSRELVIAALVAGGLGLLSGLSGRRRRG